MTTVQTDSAIAWVRAQAQGADRLHPWMATVSYNSIHTPYQQPPPGLYPPGFVWPSTIPEHCGNDAAQPDPLYPTSCAIRQAGLYTPMGIAATRTWAIRNHQYKLVKLERAPCESALGEFEFYDLTPSPPMNPLGLDLSAANLLTNGQPVNLTPAQKANFDDLMARLPALLDSEPACYGDGNLDRQVDASDLAGARRYLGQPSVFDFNRSGATDTRDVQCVMANFGNNCRVNGPGKTCR